MKKGCRLQGYEVRHTCAPWEAFQLHFPPPDAPTLTQICTSRANVQNKKTGLRIQIPKVHTPNNKKGAKAFHFQLFLAQSEEI